MWTRRTSQSQNIPRTLHQCRTLCPWPGPWQSWRYKVRINMVFIDERLVNVELFARSQAKRKISTCQLLGNCVNDYTLPVVSKSLPDINYNTQPIVSSANDHTHTRRVQERSYPASWKCCAVRVLMSVKVLSRMRLAENQSSRPVLRPSNVTLAFSWQLL